ncbi:putative ATP-binding cassette transporter [Pseudomonas delhiensis]|uniref:ATP-binding cassette transporter n=1 Tax=Pseudomonas delhiensis TaxID=366289 RepID=A0A239NIJ8_9PSED|nr:cyclic peptide export ABC transporter [Pseudomonas delhiensis]SDK77187.1 putative ATP-binding cassette transporter [Pseudomonas delhiensis]SNT54138.1 putative ATP-binding cassette transporter [Pseudomonas delhiensis]
MSATQCSATRELLGILKPFWAVLALSIFLGVVGGISITALLTAINRVLNAEGGMTQGMMLAFAAICALALLSAILSNIGTNYVGQKIIAHLRESLGGRVLCAPIEQLERYRTHRLIPVLTHDIDTVSDLAFGLPQLVISLTITLGCLAYLATLSPSMFLVTAAAVVLGSVVQYIARGYGISGFEAAREQEDLLQKHFRSMAEGAKELRIHRPRRQRLYSRQLRETVERICRLQVRSVNIFLTANTIGSLLFFIVIAVALAMQGWWANGDRSVLSGFVMTLLFMKGPLESVLSLLPLLSRNRIALRRIAELNEQFSNPEPYLLLNEELPIPTVEPLRTLELRDVRYTYPAVGDNPPFVMGPLNLKIEAGEMLFIVGENGGGKTTLIKLLLGLYAPHGGEVLVNGKVVEASSRDDYRQLFTTIFADFFLFEELMDGQRDIPAEAARYLERLEIGHKVGVADGAFTTTDLSTGQRKRLALVHAWLDQRPILVFDEWAADQDPTFRRIFYTELLPDLKRQGKTLIVISHDDRYFDVADQLVRMEQGQLIREQALA